MIAEITYGCCEMKYASPNSPAPMAQMNHAAPRLVPGASINSDGLCGLTCTLMVLPTGYFATVFFANAALFEVTFTPSDTWLPTYFTPLNS